MNEGSDPRDLFGGMSVDTVSIIQLQSFVQGLSLDALVGLQGCSYLNEC